MTILTKTVMKQTILLERIFDLLVVDLLTFDACCGSLVGTIEAIIRIVILGLEPSIKRTAHLSQVV